MSIDNDTRNALYAKSFTPELVRATLDLTDTQQRLFELMRAEMGNPQTPSPESCLDFVKKMKQKGQGYIEQDRSQIEEKLADLVARKNATEEPVSDAQIAA